MLWPHQVLILAGQKDHHLTKLLFDPLVSGPEWLEEVNRSTGQAIALLVASDLGVILRTAPHADVIALIAERLSEKMAAGQVVGGTLLGMRA